MSPGVRDKYEIEQLELARDEDIADLMEEMRRSANNFPGFVRDNRISNQVQSVRAQAQSDINYIKRKIDKLQGEIREIRRNSRTK